MTTEEMRNLLSQSLSADRYQHSIRVMEEACRLARHYQVDPDKAEIAGLLHDCAKQINRSDAMVLLRKAGIPIDEIQEKSPSLFHGLLGPYIAKKRYGVTDDDILDAICWHTTGRAGMTPLEKIIFIADFIEAGRTYEGVEEARKAAYRNLDLCVLICSNIAIRHVLREGKLLHRYTVETRNDAILRLEKSHHQ